MKAVVAIAAALVVGFAQAATQPEAGATRKPVLDQQTEQFVNSTAKGSMGEVALLRWVLTRTDDPRIGQFADHLIQDHSKVDAELRQISERLGISMPEPMTAEQQRMQEHLSNLQGQQFGQEFAQGQIEYHRQDLAKFENYAKTGRNADVRAFVEKTLPTLRDHLAMAQDLDKSFRQTSMNRSDEPRQFETAYAAPRSMDTAAYDDLNADEGDDSAFYTSYETAPESFTATSCNSCARNVSYSACDTGCDTCDVDNKCCAKMGCDGTGIVYDNDWHAGETGYVTCGLCGCAQ